MKKLVLITIFAFYIVGIQAQNADFRKVLSVNIGANTFQFLNKKLEPSTAPGEAVKYTYGNLKTTPTFQLAWDYGIVKWFSVGLAGSYNRAKYTYDNINYKGQNLGAANLAINRTTIAARIFFHYGNRNNWDFYSGGRLGIGLWSGRVSLDANDDLARDLIAKIDEDLQGYVPKFIRKKLLNNVGASAGFIAPQIQFVPIGVRGYINDHIGLGAELALGSPYYLAGNVNYRF